MTRRIFSRPVICAAALALALPGSGRAESATSSSAAAGHRVRHEEFHPVTRMDGGQAEITMTVGTVREVHRAHRVEPGRGHSFPVSDPGAGDTLLLTMVVPDDLEGHRYDFELQAGGQVIQRRGGTTRGFGRRSFFVRLPTPVTRSGGSVELTLINRCEEDLFFGEPVLLRGFDAVLTEKAPEEFILGLLVNDLKKRHLIRVAAALPEAPGVRKALGCEVYYVERTPEDLERQLELARTECDRHGLSFLPVLCSWWAGTPLAVKQRIDFQQICWSETDTLDEGEKLREFLGPKWDLRYGLTVPNKWSSTAWQTMNSPELNRLRHTRLADAVGQIERILGGRVAGYVAENEPAYWAFEGSDHEYPVRRKNLWADFNPQTVAQAEREGIVLDPADGLDLTERIWLHYNVARYNQATVDVMTSTAAAGGRPVYSHALLDYDHFPLAGTGHARPYAEVARVGGARTGVEIIWKTDMDALWRVREWGAWGCVNREEWDGYSLPWHVATLRACYMMGADMVNSYNWQRMGREGDPVEYFTEFLDDLGGRDGVVVVGERTTGRQWRPVREWDYGLVKNDPCPWANAVELTLRCRGTTAPLEVWMTDGVGGPVVAWRTLDPADVASTGPTRIRFGDLTLIEQNHDLHLHLRAGQEGWEMLGSWWGPNYRLLCDLKEERARSSFLVRRP